MSGEPAEDGYRYAQVGSCVVVAPIAGARMSYPGTLTREQATQIFGERMVESIDKWVAEETAAHPPPLYQPPTLVGYRLYRQEGRRLTKVAHFTGGRKESFAQIFRSRR